MRFVSKPVIVEAVQWKGNNEDEVKEWLSKTFTSKTFTLDDRTDGKPLFNVDRRAMRAYIWDKLSYQWVKVKEGDWIVCGTAGEYYPCNAEMFAEKYTELAD